MTTDIPEADAFGEIQAAFGGEDVTASSESLSKLLEMVDKDVIAWRPEAGDIVAGVLRDVSDSSENEYGTYVILMIETPTGKLVNVHCFHLVLKRDIERRLQRGTLKVRDEIAIKYIGEAEKQDKGKSAANLYRVVVNRP